MGYPFFILPVFAVNGCNPAIIVRLYWQHNKGGDAHLRAGFLNRAGSLFGVNADTWFGDPHAPWHNWNRSW